MNNRVLILTDHTNHSSENSLYDLSVKMLAHSNTKSIDIASRGNKINSEFFNSNQQSKLWATRINQEFKYEGENHPLSKDFIQVNLTSYDLIWLRLPPPINTRFLDHLDEIFSNAVIINNPKGITQTGSKAFLINFPNISPPMKICYTLKDIIEFKKSFPIVLKPFREYGGRGIVKISNDLVISGTANWSFDEFAKTYNENPVEYLAVKYLKNVTKGDKRIVVVNGEILGASLRMPANDSWLCNVSMGGSSHFAEVKPEEVEIIKIINPKLAQLGIVMYGVDTLVNDDGKRILSEINTTSIGGLPQIAKKRNEPLVEKAIDLIWKYFNDKKKENG